MSDRDEIKRLFTRLVEELTRADMDNNDPDFGKVIGPVSQLATGFLIDTNRIANALEKLVELEQVRYEGN